MDRRTKRRVNREIAAVAKLEESKIDTSEVPQIMDWSGAVVGRFYGTYGIAALQNQDSKPQSPAIVSTGQTFLVSQQPVTAATVGMYQNLTATELIAECATGTFEAWSEFVRRWHRLIAGVVTRAAARWEHASVDVEDLVQEVYFRLAANELKILKDFKSAASGAFPGYLEVVTINVVIDHFRARRAVERSGRESVPTLEITDIQSSEQEALFSQEQEVLFGQIDRLLEDSVSERDREIFRMYYRLGLTAKQIAAIPGIKLGSKGVESVLYRLTKFVKDRMSGDIEQSLKRPNQSL